MLPLNSRSLPTLFGSGSCLFAFLRGHICSRRLVIIKPNPPTYIMPVMPTEGSKAPDFTLKDTNGSEVTLSKLRGKKVVLYFYPRDDTPGCTVEACAFRDNLARVKKKGALVFGISKDDEKSHQKFTEKYNLNFPLLSDPENKVIEKYGAWAEKSMYGKKFMGIVRSTFIIDEEGRIMKVFPRVTPEGHAEEVLQALDS